MGFTGASTNRGDARQGHAPAADSSGSHNSMMEANPLECWPAICVSLLVDCRHRTHSQSSLRRDSLALRAARFSFSRLSVAPTTPSSTHGDRDADELEPQGEDAGGTHGDAGAAHARGDLQRGQDARGDSGVRDGPKHAAGARPAGGRRLRSRAHRAAPRAVHGVAAARASHPRPQEEREQGPHGPLRDRALQVLVRCFVRVRGMYLHSSADRLLVADRIDAGTLLS
jgi:hypothetical protein